MDLLTILFWIIIGGAGYYLGKQQHVGFATTIQSKQKYTNLSSKEKDDEEDNEMALIPTQKYFSKDEYEDHQKEFDKLDTKEKQELINNATNTEKIAEIVKNLVKQDKVPKEAEISTKEEYHPLSLLQAAGKRIYSEGSGATEVGPKYRDLLEKYESEGSPISMVFGMEAAEALSILTGNPAYVDSSAKRGPIPSPEGLTKEHFDREMAIYRKYLQAPPGTLIPEREHLLTAAEGLHELFLQEDGSSDTISEIEAISSKLGSKKLNKDIQEHDRSIDMSKLLTQDNSVKSKI